MRYDEENLELVKASLNSSLEDIPALNRFQLVLDYGMFALAGLEPLSEVSDYSNELSKRNCWRLQYYTCQYNTCMRKKIEPQRLNTFLGCL